MLSPRPTCGGTMDWKRITRLAEWSALGAMLALVVVVAAQLTTWRITLGAALIGGIVGLVIGVVTRR